MSRPATREELTRAGDAILAVRFILNAVAQAARGDLPPEPSVLDYLSDRLSDAVALIEEPDTAGGRP